MLISIFSPYSEDPSAYLQDPLSISILSSNLSYELQLPRSHQIPSSSSSTQRVYIVTSVFLLLACPRNFLKAISCSNHGSHFVSFFH